MENRAENITNVTYTAPTEAGGIETTVDEQLQRRPQGAMTSVAVAVAVAAAGMPRVGRNDLCPCGSGKKFKVCHGRLT